MPTSSTDSTQSSICFALFRISHNAAWILSQPLHLR